MNGGDGLASYGLTTPLAIGEGGQAVGKKELVVPDVPPSTSVVYPQVYKHRRAFTDRPTTDINYPFEDRMAIATAIWLGRISWRQTPARGDSQSVVSADEKQGSTPCCSQRCTTAARKTHTLTHAHPELSCLPSKEPRRRTAGRVSRIWWQMQDLVLVTRQGMQAALRGGRLFCYLFRVPRLVNVQSSASDAPAMRMPHLSPTRPRPA